MRGSKYEVADLERSHEEKPSARDPEPLEDWMFGVGRHSFSQYAYVGVASAAHRQRLLEQSKGSSGHGAAP